MIKNNYVIEGLAKELVEKFENQNNRTIVPKDKNEFGYDMKSVDSNGTVRLIEIKSSEKSHLINRWLEEKEFQAMESSKDFYVYYILDLNVDTRSGRILVIHKDEWEKHYYRTEVHRWYKFGKKDFQGEGTTLSLD